MTKIKKTKIKNLIVFEGKLHKDQRGYLREIIRENEIKKKFKFQIVSKSKKKCFKRIAFSI